MMSHTGRSSQSFETVVLHSDEMIGISKLKMTCLCVCVLVYDTQ